MHLANKQLTEVLNHKDSLYLNIRLSLECELL